MDERQTQVVSGAGLQESRINTEFVEFLSKWGPRVLYVLLAVVLAFLGLQQWERHKIRLNDQAFADYEAQVASRSPDLLLKVAEDHAGNHAVWSLATRDAANLIMDAAIIGTKPGADPLAPQPTDVLTAEERSGMFQQAEKLYKDIIAKNPGGEGQLIYAEQARWGLTSAQLSLGKTAEGEKTLEDFIAAADKGKLDDLAAFGRARLTSFRDVKEIPEILVKADLPPGASRGSVLFDPSIDTVTDPSSGLSVKKIDPVAPPLEDSPLPESVDPSEDPGSE